jgi:hypothetical protein
MKITPLPLFILLAGCASKSPYDISSADLTKHRIISGHVPDFDHLPKDAKKVDHVYKKGETLPDGTIAKGEAHIITINP